jgi:hypothetical protein
MPFIIQALYRFPKQYIRGYRGDWRVNNEPITRWQRVRTAWRVTSLGDCLRYRVWR